MAPSSKNDQTFSFEIVSCLLASLLSSGTIIGNTHFALMEKIDGSTTKSGYEHRFRAVKARAKEINDQVAKGGVAVAATPSKPKGGSAKTATPSGSKKRSKFLPNCQYQPHANDGEESRSETVSAAPSDNSGERNDDDEEETKTPSKKVKNEVKDDDDLLE